MLLDIILLVLLVIAVIKGLRKGLIVALFSVIGLIVGLAAAMKLSVLSAGYIGKAVKISDEWLPFVAFAAVFIVVVLLVRWGASLLQKSLEFAMLGWLNRIGGVLLYVSLYILIFSIFVFYADQMDLIRPETKALSVTYSYIEPWGPRVMDTIGKLIPFFKGMFNDLESFFDVVSQQVPPAG